MVSIISNRAIVSSEIIRISFAISSTHQLCTHLRNWSILRIHSCSDSPYEISRVQIQPYEEGDKPSTEKTEPQLQLNTISG